MRIFLFTSGAAILGLGVAAHFLLDKPHAAGFLEGALKLGGGIVICGLFSLKMPWHGIIGAGILALLGAARGLGNLPGLAKFFAGDQSQGTQPLLEVGVTAICLLLLISVGRALLRERTRRMLERD